MPIVAGPRAVLALEAYARVVCGGRLFHVQVTPPFLEPADILGKVDPARARFLPHPDSLIDILETASKATGLACVILEGINRAPTESYLLPVLQCALGKRSLRLFHPATVAADDPYCDCAELHWPSNVFISATLIEGPTTLPVSRDLWSMAALIETDGSAPSALPSPWRETTELDPESSLVKPSEPLSDLVDEILEDWPEYGSFRDVFGRFFNALALFESDRYKRERALVESLLLPLIASLDDEEDRYKELQRVKARELTGTDLLEPAVLVHRMRRRIA